MKRNAGFTLIEVMVALTVFAVVSVALVRNTMTSLRQASAIQDKTVALWIAENEVTRIRLQDRSDDNFPSVGTDRDFVEMAGIEWQIETEVEATENEFIRRVTVRVSREEAEDAAVALVGFVGRY